jgi:hypothetical protein
VGAAVNGGWPTPTVTAKSVRFCLPLTEAKQDGNHSVATVGAMNVADLDLHRRPGLGVRPGESDPAAMLARVLLLLAFLTVLAALGLAWWLV